MTVTRRDNVSRVQRNSGIFDRDHQRSLEEEMDSLARCAETLTDISSKFSVSGAGMV